MLRVQRAGLYVVIGSSQHALAPDESDAFWPGKRYALLASSPHPRTHYGACATLVFVHSFTSLDFLGLPYHAQERKAQGAGAAAVRLEAAHSARESIHESTVEAGRTRA